MGCREYNFVKEFPTILVSMALQTSKINCHLNSVKFSRKIAKIAKQLGAIDSHTPSAKPSNFNVRFCPHGKIIITLLLFVNN